MYWLGTESWGSSKKDAAERISGAKALYLYPVMITQQITIVNRLGLHARAASKFVNLSKAYASNISLSLDNQHVDGKSIMNVMLLAAAKGAVLTLSTEGEDEAQAFDELSALIADRFGEPD